MLKLLGIIAVFLTSVEAQSKPLVTLHCASNERDPDPVIHLFMKVDPGAKGPNVVILGVQPGVLQLSKTIKVLVGAPRTRLEGMTNYTVEDFEEMAIQVTMTNQPLISGASTLYEGGGAMTVKNEKVL